MIKKVNYADIDFDKYKNCLENACQNSDYADKTFLDIVSNKNWFLLIQDDYETVMPVSFVRKFGITFILMPKLCQQLGIFSKVDDPKTNQLFLDYLNKKFFVLIYAFNGDNHFIEKTQQRTSYFLSKNSYPNTKKNYSVHRRRNVRIIGDLINNIQFQNNLTSQNNAFFLTSLLGTNKEKDKKAYFKIYQKLINHNIGDVRTLKFKNKIQSFVYLFEGKRSRYLSLFINKSPLENPNFPSIMIDKCLQEFIEDKNFDFMGSEIENVANFNERFGATFYKYPIIINSKRALFKKLWKR